jgi:hypothetical protein
MALATPADSGAHARRDTAAGVLHDTLEAHGDIVTAVAWSPGGARLASAAGGPLLQLRLVGVSEGSDQPFASGVGAERDYTAAGRRPAWRAGRSNPVRRSDRHWRL